MHAAIIILAGLVFLGGFGSFVLMFFREPPDWRNNGNPNDNTGGDFSGGGV